MCWIDNLVLDYFSRTISQYKRRNAVQRVIHFYWVILCFNLECRLHIYISILTNSHDLRQANARLRIVLFDETCIYWCNERWVPMTFHANWQIKCTSTLGTATFFKRNNSLCKTENSWFLCLRVGFSIRTGLVKSLWHESHFNIFFTI